MSALLIRRSSDSNPLLSGVGHCAVDFASSFNQCRSELAGGFGVKIINLACRTRWSGTGHGLRPVVSEPAACLRAIVYSSIMSENWRKLA
jgi:hypothetical protein